MFKKTINTCNNGLSVYHWDVSLGQQNHPKVEDLITNIYKTITHFFPSSSVI